MDVRRTTKQALAIGLEWSGARRLIAGTRRALAGGRRVVVFGYHRVCADFQSERERTIDSCLISRATFERHVTFLAEHFELMTMTRALDVIQGRVAPEHDVAVITFDDGYADVLENALPVLERHRVPATIYVSTSVIDRAGHFPHDRLYTLLQLWQQNDFGLRNAANGFARTALTGGTASPHDWLRRLIAERTPAELERLIDELSSKTPVPVGPPSTAAALGWDGVRALAAAGWDIGAHTTGHCVLTHLPPDAIEEDLRACHAAIEHATGRPPQHFAYCNGYYNDDVILALRRVGFRSAVTTEDRLNHLGDDPYRIGRRVLWEGTTAGASGRPSTSLIACQLDDTWSSLGFNASEPGWLEAKPREHVLEADRRLA